MLGQFQRRERLFNISFHESHRIYQALGRVAQTVTQRHMLAFIGQANTVADELLRDLLGQAWAVMLAN